MIPALTIYEDMALTDGMTDETLEKGTEMETSQEKKYIIYTLCC